LDANPLKWIRVGIINRGMVIRDFFKKYFINLPPLEPIIQLKIYFYASATPIKISQSPSHFSPPLEWLEKSPPIPQYNFFGVVHHEFLKFINV
jgi:hypothetical protein